MLTGRLVSEREAAEALRVSTRTLRRLRSEGELGYVQFGRRVLYKPADLAAVLERNYVPVRGGR